MNFVNVNPRRKRRHHAVNPFFNLVNDVLATSAADLERKHVKTKPAANLFNTNISNFVGSDFVSNIPSVNVSETGDDFKIELAAPGLEKGDFDINVEKDQLTISVKKETSDEVKEEKFTRKEFSYSSFTRSFHLPEGVKSDAIEANYENGILGIVLPKKEEAKELPARRIEVG